MTILDYYIIYFVALLPALFIINYVYSRDIFPEDKREVGIAFFLGVSTILFLELLIPIVETFNDAFFTGYGNIAFWVYFRAATLEEFFKLLVVYFYAYKLSNFNEPMDAVVFATAASLGFAAVENVDYAFLSENADENFDVVFARAFSAVPLHGLCGILMGLFFGLAAFGRRNNKKYLFYSLAIPVVVHGSYNFVLSIGAGILIYLLLIVLVIKAASIIEKLNIDQIARGKEDLSLTYEITFKEISVNALKVTGLIIIGVITLEVFFN